MKLLSLISGGIDSPVSTYLMLKKADIIAVHFDNQPFTDKNQMNKAIELVRHLEKITNKKIKIYIIAHGKNQLNFVKNCKRNLNCLFCRRMMFRVAEKIAKKEVAKFLLTGESLGQVASQTLTNIKVESRAIKIPILRPLIGFDKIEIERIAKKIGTYEISISPGLCCTIVPNKPRTSAKLEDVLREEEKVDIEKMVEDAVENAMIL